MKFSREQIKLIISQTIDILSVFGNPATIAENLSFIVMFIKSTKITHVEWSYQNQLMLALQKISLGLTLTVDYTKINNQSRATYIGEADFSSPQLILKSSTLNETDGSIIPNQLGQSVFKSPTVMNEFAYDAYTAKVIKAEVLYNRRIMHEEAYECSKSITRREIAQESIFMHELSKIENKLEEVMDRDKRYYKENILK